MTIEDLMKIFHEAQHEFTYTAPGIGGDRIDRAGVRAVVEALRDEMLRKEGPETHNLSERIGLRVGVTMLDKILDSDAGEKVAGGTNGEGAAAAEPNVAMPATDPILYSPALERLVTHADAAPAVCVWTGEEYVTYSTSCESEHEVDPHKAPPKHCPSCGLPIKFTEAK